MFALKVTGVQKMTKKKLEGAEKRCCNFVGVILFVWLVVLYITCFYTFGHSLFMCFQGNFFGELVDKTVVVKLAREPHSNSS